MNKITAEQLVEWFIKTTGGNVINKSDISLKSAQEFLGEKQGVECCDWRTQDECPRHKKPTPSKKEEPIDVEAEIEWINDNGKEDKTALTLQLLCRILNQKQ